MKPLTEREKWYKAEFKKLYKGEVCEVCEETLTDEEKEHLGDMCFKCVRKIENDIYGEKHPDDRG